MEGAVRLPSYQPQFVSPVETLGHSSEYDGQMQDPVNIITWKRPQTPIGITTLHLLSVSIKKPQRAWKYFCQVNRRLRTDEEEQHHAAPATMWTQVGRYGNPGLFPGVTRTDK